MQSTVCPVGLSTSDFQQEDLKLNLLGLFHQGSSVCSSFEAAIDWGVLQTAAVH
jgi:hypothetical protein